jgi:hypothetical protein
MIINSAGSSPTVLEERYFDLFDRTYAEVTRKADGNCH